MIRKAFVCVGLALILACAALPMPISAPTSLFSISTPSDTSEPTETSTTTPLATSEPTETPTADLSATPEPMATPVPAVSSASPTPTPTIPSKLGCTLIWKSPKDGSVFNTGQKFSAGWNIKNSGTATWDAGSFEFTYLDGARLAPGSLVPLNESVQPGESVVLSVPMKAPKYPGAFITYWGIRQGDTFFCRLALKIIAE